MPRDDDGREYLEVGGLRARVGTDEECEAAALVVCSEQSVFADDVHTICARCARAIVHRPYAPTRPPKVCLSCAAAFLREVTP